MAIKTFVIDGLHYTYQIKKELEHGLLVAVSIQGGAGGQEFEVVVHKHEGGQLCFQANKKLIKAVIQGGCGPSIRFAEQNTRDEREAHTVPQGGCGRERPALKNQSWLVQNSVSKTVIHVEAIKQNNVIFEPLGVVGALKTTDKGLASSDRELKSPLAGRVIKILAKKGDCVQKNSPLVIIESMKMENEICAPRTACIKTIFISEGNVVQPEQVLVDFEEGESDAGAKSSNGEKAI